MKLPGPLSQITSRIPKFRPTGIGLVNAIGAVIALYLLVILGQTIKKNYELGRQVDSLNSQIANLQDQQDELTYNIEYYKTDSFRDREARSKLGLQLPGESVVIIPHATPAPTPPPATTPKSKTSAAKSNLQQWFDFLTGRQH